jgi:hypothetical protein
MPKTPVPGAQPMTAKESEPCVLCHSQLASPKGEHVWPNWYLKDCEAAGQPAFPYWSYNGQPITDREGRPIGSEKRMRVQLPVCVTCNSILEARFETPTKAILRRLFAADGATALTADEAGKVGAWFTKVLLLLIHPQIRYEHPNIGDRAVRLDPTELPPDTFYTWLVTGSPPPLDLSLWVHRADLRYTQAPRFEMPLPLVTAEGTTIQFLASELCTHGLSLTLVVHPGWKIEHPLEALGEAVRLTPIPDKPVDLAALPVLWPKTVQWLQAQLFKLKPGVLASPNLPPLHASGLPFAAQPGLDDFTDEQSFIGPVT